MTGSDSHEHSAADLRTRYMQQAADEKLSDEWGQMKAEALWKSAFAGGAVDLQGKSFLDFGCSWGYFGRYLFDHAGIARYTGFDLVAFWESARTSWDWESDSRVRLCQGDVRTEPSVQSDRFDVIFTYGTLFTIPPEDLHQYLEWFLDHLEPGGMLIAATHTFSSWCGGSLMRDIAFPGPHLLFSRPVIDSFLAKHGISSGSSPSVSILTAGSYLALYRSVGFEIATVRRSRNKIDDSLTERCADKLAAYPSTDLDVSVLTTYLSKPTASSEGSAFAVLKPGDRARGIDRVRQLFRSDRTSRTSAPADQRPTMASANVRWDLAAESESVASAQSLLSRFELAVPARRVLHVGCGYGTLGRALVDQGAASYTGIELSPLWEQHERPGAHGAGTTLICGEIDQVDELAGKAFDLVIAVNVIDWWSPTVLTTRLSWLFDHLDPGGRLVVRVRPWSSRRWADIDRLFDIPAPQLLHPLRSIHQAVRRRYDWDFNPANFLLSGTYTALANRVGFEIVELARAPNDLPADHRERFNKRLGDLPADEIDVQFLDLHLIRPWQIGDDSGDLATVGADWPRRT